MRRKPATVLITSAVLVAVLALALRSGRMPLGVPGEWTWPRLQVAPSTLGVLMGLGAVAAYAAFAMAGFRALANPGGRPRLRTWLFGLVVGSVAVQGFVQEAAPEGYGLAKWIIALHSSGSSGYYTVAKSRMDDPGRFLAEYPGWIARQDALHVGTHPPGLFVLARWSLDRMRAHPALARWIGELAPRSVSDASRVFRETAGLPRLDAAALTLTGALTLLACSLTVVPLYLLARLDLSSPASWAAAALWPLVPSASMFQPTADTAFPLLSTSALALADWAARSGSTRGVGLCVGSGLAMALGMWLTLAFLPVGLVVALVLATTPGRSILRRLGLIGATGLGFAAGTVAWWMATTANPLAIWWINQRNHARFYVEYPRSYLAWVAANPVELAVALGFPSAVWAILGLGSRRCPRVAWVAALVLVGLTISGKNLSEVARLWLPLMPPLLVAAAAGFSRLEGDARTLGGSVALVGLQTLVLEWTIQVVYPV